MDAKQLPKSEPLEKIRTYRYFRFQKELALHTTVPTDADRFIGLIESQGVVEQAHKLEVVALEEVHRREKEKTRSHMDQRDLDTFLTYQLEIGIRD